MDNYKADAVIESLDEIAQLLRKQEETQSRFLEVLERAYPPALAPTDEYHSYKVTRPNGQEVQLEARSTTHAAQKVWDSVGSIFEPRSEYKVERLD